MSIANLKIGRKIAAVLGGIVLVLAGLSALSLWGNRTNGQTAEILIQRLTKARLAGTIAGESAAIGQSIGKELAAKKANNDILNEIAESRKSRAAALEEFQRLADSPTSIKHGADMAELIQVAAAAADRVTTLLNSGRSAEASQAFRTFSAASASLRVKAKEAEVFQVSRVAENEKSRGETSDTIWTAMIAGSIFAIAIAMIGGFVLTRGIATPLTAVVANLEQIAHGDLSKDAPPEFQARVDEIGTLARAMQKMIVSLRTLVQEISGGIGVLASSSTELLSTSSQMTAGSRSASDRAHSVAAAAEEMSSNIASVAAGMEQTTANLANVATATEQMTSTIGEIAGNSEKARRITAEATRQAARITEQIDQLGQATREIGKVTETITEISSQTNLLALNATIEAARAGSAGKGFAVVANEIKALAQQTAGATEDIKARITGVQAATSGGIAEIEKISRVIDEVSGIVTSIAAAIEEQATATKSIAGNIGEASLGVTDANKRVSETSQVSHEIARDVGGVDSALTEMASGSNDVRSSAAALSKVAETLKVTAGRFHV